MSALRKFLVQVDKMTIDHDLTYVFNEKLYINTVKISAITPTRNAYCIELGSEEYFVNVSKESGDKIINLMGLYE